MRESWYARGNRDERAANFERSMNKPEKNCFQGTTIGARQVNSSYHHRVPILGELGMATSSQLSGTSPSIMIPLGSTEQHGPHLPLDTDTRIATAVARGAAKHLEHGWLVAPAIAYGASGEHQSFAGTISIGTEALTMLLVEYAGRPLAGPSAWSSSTATAAMSPR